jgi:ribose 1,5-bisphosphokinase PhnN
MAESENRWVARLTPTASSSADLLLALPIGMDVWERHGQVLVVGASEAQLSELERRRLAFVERLSTPAEFEARAQRRADRNAGGRSE